MQRYLFIAVICSLTAGGVSANSFLDLGNEIRIPVPAGWKLAGDSTEYPFQIINEPHNAELLVFKSVIDETDIITNDKELKAAVDKVVEDVILALPDATVLTNTGYFERNRAWFALDFVSFDTSGNIPLLHRLQGIIYRHPAGHELLFTLWAKAQRDLPSAVMDDLRAMQQGFAYYGPVEDYIFADSSRKTWYWLTGAMLMVIVLAFLLRKRRLERVAFSEDPNLWRCECGRLNHSEYRMCRRCGRERTTETTV